LLRAAITGVSAYVAPDGSVRGQLGIFREGVISVRVLGLRVSTVYTRWPWLVPLLCTLVAAVSLVLARKTVF
jgi:apolipoprotein N-acyltransferase